MQQPADRQTMLLRSGSSIELLAWVPLFFLHLLDICTMYIPTPVSCSAYVSFDKVEHGDLNHYTMHGA